MLELPAVDAPPFALPAVFELPPALVVPPVPVPPAAKPPVAPSPPVLVAPPVDDLPPVDDPPPDDDLPPVDKLPPVALTPDSPPAAAPPVLDWPPVAVLPPSPAVTSVRPLDSVCDPEQPAVKSKRAKDIGPSFGPAEGLFMILTTTPNHEHVAHSNALEPRKPAHPSMVTTCVE